VPLDHFACLNCGFWQRHFAPPDCPVCTDFRHPLPPDGWRFARAGEVDASVACRWEEVAPGVTMFWTEPRIGIGPCGYLIQTAAGNVAFEGAGWYDEAALAHVASLGGVRWLSGSHGHVYGALWRLVERFAPEVVVHTGELPLAQAFRVSWPFDDSAELAPGVTLWHTGGHTPGHAVLHWAERRALLCGDALKFTFDAAGRADTISCHKAFDAHIPLSHADVRRYRVVIEPLDFDAVFTPWECVPHGGKQAALALFAAQLAGRPFADRLPITATLDATGGWR
jgi:hypothetical protein